MCPGKLCCVNSLEPGVPYHVRVAAVNRAGQGEIRTTINFTRELSKSAYFLIHALLIHFIATSISPTNVTVDRTSPTTMVVSWRPLTLTEARGVCLPLHCDLLSPNI